MQAGWEDKRQRGKEKTRLSQHDLQIALSPWRLLSALSSIQSGESKRWCHSLMVGGGYWREAGLKEGKRG